VQVDAPVHILQFEGHALVQAGVPKNPDTQVTQTSSKLQVAQGETQ
jgi:hypothetical protein